MRVSRSRSLPSLPEQECWAHWSQSPRRTQIEMFSVFFFPKRINWPCQIWSSFERPEIPRALVRVQDGTVGCLEEKEEEFHKWGRIRAILLTQHSEKILLLSACKQLLRSSRWLAVSYRATFSDVGSSYRCTSNNVQCLVATLDFYRWKINYSSWRQRLATLTRVQRHETITRRPHRNDPGQAFKCLTIEMKEKYWLLLINLSPLLHSLGRLKKVNIKFLPNSTPVLQLAIPNVFIALIASVAHGPDFSAKPK